MSDTPEQSATDRDGSPVFGEYSRCYDLLYRDKDYAAESDYVARLIRRFHPPAASILELGSGTGVHAGLLADRGFSVHGVERSRKMLSRARVRENRDRLSLTFTEGDIRAVRLGESFDAVVALFHVISYQTTNEDATAVFETARHHLRAGGVFVFDAWYGPAVLTERPAVRIKRMADGRDAVTRLAEPVLHPNENVVDVHYHVFARNLATNGVDEFREVHAMRYFFKPEIERIAKETGFRCEHAEEWLSGKPIGCGTWGACFVLRAN